MESPKYLLVDSKVLPDVFLKVLEAKTLLAKGKAKNSSEAARMSGLSRSAFYKYKDSIFEYDSRMRGSMTTLYISLEDEPGVLSSVMGCICDMGGNIITINQNIPADGVAPVTISLRLGKEHSSSRLIAALLEQKGVIRAREI